MEPIKLTEKRPGVIEATDAMGLFEAGGRFMDAKAYREALLRYDRLIVQFPNSRLIGSALYNAGLAHEQLREFDKAAARYRTLVIAHGHRDDAVDAAFRLGGCYAELRDWKHSAQVFAALAARKRLSSADRVESYAREGLAHFRRNDHVSARRTIETGIRFLNAIDAFERLDSDFFAGMLYYYLAAIPHAQFRETPLSAAKDAQLGNRLDQKARLLLVSQRRYIETIRLKNPYWATVAGFQIGSLYRELYDALMVSLPDFGKVARKNARRAKIGVETAKKQLIETYLQTLHAKIKPLLQKAMRVFEKNVVVARRIGVQGPWIDKSRRQIEELKQLITASPDDIVNRAPKQVVAPEDVPGISAPTHEPDEADPSRAVM